MKPENRIQTLVQNVRKNQGELQRGAKLHLRVGAALTIGMAIYLGFVTVQLRKVDAEAFTNFARLEIQNQLPETSAAIQQQLAAQAPAVVSRTLESALQGVPEVRRTFVKKIIAEQSAITAEFERQLLEVSHEAIRMGKENLEKVEGDHTDVQRFEILMTLVTDQFRQEIDEGLDALYPRYSSELHWIKTSLTELQTTDDAEMTENGKVQKELIETLLQLMSRSALTQPVDGRAL